MQNIVASFNPDAKKRVLLCAHWDTRPWADEDIVDQDKPILGANDGGSGVGVLIEIARQLSQNPIDLGVDIVLFDAEDYGNSDIVDSYCLGSQYWSKKPHIPGYKAKYGILLDMVGAEGAYFFQEGVSMHYAADVVKKVWETAHKAGYRQYFIFNQFDFSQLTDDHLYVNRYAKIPCIDIIQYDKNNPKGFGSFWHTHEDNMNIISTATLKAVGQTVLEVLYREAAGVL